MITSRRLNGSLVLVLLVLAVAAPVSARKTKTAKHPAQLAYDSLDWQVPLGEPHLKVLANGIHAYIASDSSLPAVTVLGQIRFGSLDDPEGKEGLSYLLVQLLRSGGIVGMPADTLDMVLDLHAISASFRLMEDRVQFSVSCLSEFADTALKLLGGMLFEPTFEDERIEKERDALLEMVRHRFDNPRPVLSTAYMKAMYAGAPNSRLSTAASVQSISRSDLVALHSRVIARGAPILGAAGKFDPGVMRKRLEALLRPLKRDTLGWRAPVVTFKRPYRIIIVDKDINQAYVRMALPMFRRPHPDYYACSVLNYILGGGSFSSRLNSTVRSDAGLTYSIYSSLRSNYTYPGTFYVNFYTKTESTLDAVRLVLQEVRRARDEGVTAHEVAAAKKALIDALPSMFRSKADLVDHYSWNEYYGRSSDHYRVYPDKVKAVTLADVNEMARKYLQVDSFTYVVVADTAELFEVDTASEFSLRGLAPAAVTSPDSLVQFP